MWHRVGEFSWFIFKCVVANVEWAGRWRWRLSKLVVGSSDGSSSGSVGRRWQLWLVLVGLLEKKKKRGSFDWIELGGDGRWRNFFTNFVWFFIIWN